MSRIKRELERIEGLRLVAEEIAENVGAIIECNCGDEKVYAQDDYADKQAYAAATTAWKKDKLLGSREEYISAIKDVLTNVNHECSTCGL